jgi:hypothetical protein
MTLKEILKAQNFSAEIDNFRKSYEGNELWGNNDGQITYDELLRFLLENPHMQEIANAIQELSL